MLRRPTISLVVVIHDMRREAPRTLQSLAPTYQIGIAPSDYEVIVIENGSSEPLEAAVVNALPPNFRYYTLRGHAFPVPAANFGLKKARAPIVGVMIDGGRIVTPGLLARAREAVSTHPSAVVAALGWYLGCDLQGEALERGYHSKGIEDKLLESIGWPADGYRLFEIGVPDQWSADGWFIPIGESNALFLTRASWHALNGFDADFDQPGGGAANLDIFLRALDLPESHFVVLAEEATFHQAHGGIATNAPPDVLRQRLQLWAMRYQELRGKPLSAADRLPLLYGRINPHMARRFAQALIQPTAAHKRGWHSAAGAFPDDFDPSLWDSAKAVEQRRQRDRSPAPIIEAISVAQQQFADRHPAEAAYLCRRVLTASPSHEEARRLLALTANAIPDESRASYQFVMGVGESLLGDRTRAAARYRAALRIDPLCEPARAALAQMNLPGPNYFSVLSVLHECLKPAMYLEIGVYQGDSLSVARPPTRAVCVDPEPRLYTQPSIEFTVVPETSDEFFGSEHATRLLSGGIDLAFIDGLHAFMQVVRDFWHVEHACTPGATIVLHDTLPFDEVTSRHPRETVFWTGDAWKMVPFLSICRPDLDLFTVKTAPSGLTVVRGLNPTHHESLQSFQERARLFAEWPLEDQKEAGNEWNLVDNDRQTIERRLRQPRPAVATLRR